MPASSNAPKGGAQSRVVAGIALIAIFSVAVFAHYQQPPAKQISNSDPPKTKSDEPSAVQAAKQLPEGWIELGGVARPASDVQLSKPTVPIDPKAQTLPQGFSKALAPNTNPQVQGLHDALKDRSKPSRFSSFASAEPFDLEAYKADQSKYINTIEPSRVFAPAEPGEGVPVIRSEGKRYHRVVQGESVKLIVEAAPKAPVTFSSSDLGIFENQLTSQTVEADEKGFATAVFTADGGTIDAVKILAASPMASGQVAFLVNVKLPN